MFLEPKRIGEYMTLPTDEQIEAEAENDGLIPSDHLYQGFVSGAKWARNIAEHRWIKCSERMPDKDVAVLGFIAHRPIIMIVRFNIEGEDDYWFTDEYDDCFGKNEVTHWMPLPEPPKE